MIERIADVFLWISVLYVLTATTIRTRQRAALRQSRLGQSRQKNTSGRGPCVLDGDRL